MKEENEQVVAQGEQPEAHARLRIETSSTDKERRIAEILAITKKKFGLD